ncbi:unnamed protein product [Eruca vesicaria subsp. sativa]|uniref:B3 domain-containing protein n=1 Tax=Eruca vesicaria subsp. sativa TaxID=29727 RepID=A0ABC8KUQ5_ERUVS|nr:unnamed protein product [Eruca vesicaria subsp. sativa]
MKMVTDGYDQRSDEDSRSEKRCLDLLALLGSYLEEETRSAVQVKEEEDESVSTELSLGIGTTDECKNQQNPTNYPQDYASSSSFSWSLSSVESNRHRMVSQEPIRAEPIREVKPIKTRTKRPVKGERGPTPEWLVNLMRTLNGVDAKLVIDKMIQPTDVNANQGRLLIPFNQIVEEDFLNEAELNLIDEHQRDHSQKGVGVIVVASDGRRWNANVRRWNMNCPNYSLCSGWNNVVRENNLQNKVGQVLRLWSFHSSQDGKLYLAFFHQPPPARELSLCEVAFRQLPKFPTRKRNPRLVCVPSSPPRVSDLNIPLVPEMAPLQAVVQERPDTETTTTVDLELRLGPSVDLNIPLAPPVRTEMAPLEAVQGTSLESLTERTTKVDLELRLWFK